MSNKHIIIGLSLMFTSIVGRSMVSFFKFIKSRKHVLKTGKIGRHYKGGFDSKMNKREAALILAIKESSTKKEIREAHRRLMMLNHPDSGGSTYVASKVNEAKELLLLTASEERL